MPPGCSRSASIMRKASRPQAENVAVVATWQTMSVEREPSAETRHACRSLAWSPAGGRARSVTAFEIIVEHDWR